MSAEVIGFTCATCSTRIAGGDQGVRARMCPNGHGWMDVDATCPPERGAA